MRTMATKNANGETEVWILLEEIAELEEKYKDVKNKLHDAKNYSIPVKDAQIVMLKSVLQMHDIAVPADLKIKKEVQDGVD